MRENLDIPRKTERVLKLVLLGFLLIFLRVWYLSFVQGDYHKIQATKPKRKTVIEKPERAGICDRFNLPLAVNTTEYAAAVRYADIRELPAYIRETDSEGKKIRKAVRGPYVRKLSELLAKELHIDPSFIEDIIHAKASLFPQTPFIIKNSLSEELYYKLKMLEKDHPGIVAVREAKRIYPMGKTGCDVIGYMGAIGSKEYLAIAEETKELTNYLRKRQAGEPVFLPKGYDSPLAVRRRLSILQEKAYTINDYVGKSGIERSYDEKLRGVYGSKTFEIDPKGNLLRRLPGSKKSAPGQKISLTLSAELQEFTEALLAYQESLRDIKDAAGKNLPGTPFIKGASAVVIRPKTGEVLTMASYPRFDPNDFVPSKDLRITKEKQRVLRRWTENENHIADIWEGSDDLRREIYSPETGWGEESRPLTREFFLETILSPSGAAKAASDRIRRMKEAHLLLRSFETLLEASDYRDPAALMQALYPEKPHIPCKKSFSPDALRFVRHKEEANPSLFQKAREPLDEIFLKVPHNEDKLLLLDLIRLLVLPEYWSETALQTLGDMSLDQFFVFQQTINRLQKNLREKVREIYHSVDFQKWRSENFKSFLQKKRKEEKQKNTYARPYTEYLEKTENERFSEFWKTHRYELLDAWIRNRSPDTPELIFYIETLQKEMSPLFRSELTMIETVLRSLPVIDSLKLLRGIRLFEELDRPLYGKYRSIRKEKGLQLEKHLAGAFYPISGFGYGRSQAFRQATPQGSVFKLLVAYEALRERYLYLKENFLGLDKLNPLILTDDLRTDMRGAGAKQILGFTEEGIPIRRLYKGGLMPRSSHPGIGTIDLPQAIEQSSNIYFSILAAEHIAEPSLLEKTAREFGIGQKTGIDLDGEFPGVFPNDLSDNKSGLYSVGIGQHSLLVTPLQTALMMAAFGNNGYILKPQIIRLTTEKKRLDAPFAFLEETYPFRESLNAVGIRFPLFTEPLSISGQTYVQETSPEILRKIFFPLEIKAMLFDGMRKVVLGPRGTAKASIIRYLRNNPEAKQSYLALQNSLYGKTGTAEIFHNQWIDAESKPKIHNHIWFAGLVYEDGADPAYDDAELAVAIYLRFSVAGGKEAAPLAVQIATKWRELQKKYGADFLAP